MNANPSQDMTEQVRIIHLEDNPYDQELVAAMLASAEIKCEITYADDHRTFEEALERVKADIIISDFTMPGYTGVRALQLAHKTCEWVPFIFFSGTIGEEAAIESLKQGATDYVLKQHPDRLVSAVRRALDEARLKAERKEAEEELHRRDALLRQIMENVEDLIAVVDFDGKRMLCSPSYLKLFGEAAPVTGSNILSEVHPDDKKRVQITFRQTVATSVGRRVEYRVVLADGSLRYMEAQGSVIRHNGHERYVLWVSHDITEHKFAEAKILEQAALLDEAHDAICVNDLDQHILFWNRGAERMYGWTSNEAIGRNANDLLFQSDIALAAVKTLIQRGEWRGELRQMTRSGKEIIVESRWTLITEQKGTAKSILVINTDITQRKKAEEKIQEQAALLDKAQDAIFVCDLQEQITYWNEGAARLYGWNPQEVIGQVSCTTLFEKMSPSWAEIRNAVFEKGEWLGELHQETKDGRDVIAQSHLSLIQNTSGAPTSILCINSDITEKKQIENQFLRTQRMENLGALAGGIAHDLNNILAPIMLAVEIIQDDPQSDTTGKLLDTIASSTRRGSDLVKQILSFARGVTGEKAPLQVKHVLTEIVKLVRNTFPKKISIRSEVAPNLPNILGDSTQLHQVLLNLCVNARDAMPGGGFITLDASVEQLNGRETPFHSEPVSGQFVVIKVADTGTGIPEDLLPKIFEPFFTTKEAGKGTGLGLSTVSSIVKGHGGFLEITSEIGKGTAFHVYFPVPRESLASNEPIDRARLEHGRGELILIVDDEIAIIEITCTTLNAYNYRAIAATNALDAIEIFEQRREEIALVITDMMMPAMDGLALVDELRIIKPDVKVIAVSGFADQSKINTLYNGKVQAYLSKPFTTAKLLAALNSLLHAGSGKS